MSDRLHARLHNQLALIHTTVEGALLTMGVVLSTLVTLFAVCAAIWLFEK